MNHQGLWLWVSSEKLQGVRTLGINTNESLGVWVHTWAFVPPPVCTRRDLVIPTSALIDFILRIGFFFLLLLLLCINVKPYINNMLTPRFF